MRVFIALKIPSEIQNYLAKLQSRLETSDADVKWVKPSNIHLTLKFLGEITQDEAGKVASIIKERATNKVKFAASLNSLGAFPNMNHPKVIWTGIQNGDLQIREIARELEKKLGEAGFLKEEREFNSHLTIGRVRTQRNAAKLIKEIEITGKDFFKNNLNFEVNSITLYKSVLNTDGPIYEVLRNEEFKPYLKDNDGIERC
jgi:2'-5' RNA ligase